VPRRFPPIVGAAGRPAGLHVEKRGVAMAGKYELYRDAAGKYRFRLKASNGQVIAVGEAYETKASAVKGIESVQKNAATTTVDDQTA
jgi:uncharacterized protein YegP (UPF0339 family)